MNIVNELTCLKNEIDHIDQDSIKHNNHPVTIHGQFQTIVKHLDDLSKGKEVYGTNSYWKKPKEKK